MTLRLNYSHRSAIIKAIIQDIPKPNFQEEFRVLIQNAAKDDLPFAVKEIVSSKEGLSEYLRTHYFSYMSLSGVTIYQKAGWKPPVEVVEKIRDLHEKNMAQLKEIDLLEEELRNLFEPMKTLDQLYRDLPKFSKYYPPKDDKPGNMLMNTSEKVLKKLAKAGWPKETATK